MDQPSGLRCCFGEKLNEKPVDPRFVSPPTHVGKNENATYYEKLSAESKNIYHLLKPEIYLQLCLENNTENNTMATRLIEYCHIKFVGNFLPIHAINTSSKHIVYD